MQPYNDPDSSVTGFIIGNDYIDVEFKHRSIYRYTYNSAGQQNIDAMKQLALQNDGLSSYINRHVKKLYASKLR